jgi:hypothetical protein
VPEDKAAVNTWLLTTLARIVVALDIWRGCCGTWDIEIARNVHMARGSRASQRIEA